MELPGPFIFYCKYHVLLDFNTVYITSTTFQKPMKIKDKPLLIWASSWNHDSKIWKTCFLFRVRVHDWTYPSMQVEVRKIVSLTHQNTCLELINTQSWELGKKGISWEFYSPMIKLRHWKEKWSDLSPECIQLNFPSPATLLDLNQTSVLMSK